MGAGDEMFSESLTHFLWGRSFRPVREIRVLLGNSVRGASKGQHDR